MLPCTRSLAIRSKSFHVDTWKDAMEEIKKGKADFAVLPIENSTAGIVQDIYDLLTEYDHVIVGEQIIPCEHVLMGLPGTSLFDIRTVYSHPQALMQCREFLEEHRTGSRWSGIIPLPPPKSSRRQGPVPGSHCKPLRRRSFWPGCPSGRHLLQCK